jgi:hypothetical protein
MPLTPKDDKVLRKFQSEYGAEEGKRAFYASINAGKVRNIPEVRRMAKKRQHAKRRRTRTRRV